MLRQTLFASLLLTVACDTAAPQPSDELPARGQAAGKADGQGSCEDACGGPAAEGSCYCDAECAQWGDCCEDFAAVCEPTDGDGCNLIDGCDAGQYCQWSTDAGAGVCIAASELAADAYEILRRDFNLDVDSDSPTTITRAIHVVDGEAVIGSSSYAVQVDARNDRVARVRFDVTGEAGETWRVIPEDLRDSAPWGNAEYLTPGHVMITMDGDTSLERIHEMIVGPVLDGLSMQDVDRSHDGSLWFFTLQVPPFAELETIAKIADEPDVVEAWPNRVLFLERFASDEVIAEL